MCKYFVEAIENAKYGWFWECPNGATVSDLSQSKFSKLSLFLKLHGVNLYDMEFWWK